MTSAITEASRIAVRSCTEELAPKWDEYVSEHHGASIYHTFAWKRVFERAYGNECMYLMAEQNGAAVGVLPLVFKKSRLFGKFLVSLPYFDHVGICCDREDVRMALFLSAQEVAREREADYIELRHDCMHELELLTQQSKVAMVLELPPDPEKLWSGLKAKVRNQVRKAEKEDLLVTVGCDDLVDRFFGVYVTNMRDLGSPSHSKRFFEYICDSYAEAVRIFCVKLGHITVAAGFTIASKGTLTIPWASSLQTYNSKCPNMLLYWAVIKYACESGFSRFSFGRSTPEEGTYRFKKQWGAQPKQLFWQYWISNGRKMPELNTKNAKYQLPMRMWKRLPVKVTRAIGPILIQNLS